MHEGGAFLHLTMLMFLPSDPPPVMGFTATRSASGEDIQLQWAVPSLLVARGFLQYSVEFMGSTSSDGVRRREEEEETVVCQGSPCSVPVGQGGVLITQLDPLSAYDIIVTPINEDGLKGPTF